VCVVSYRVDSVITNKQEKLHARFGVFTAVKIHVRVFLVLTPCSVAVGLYCVHLRAADGGSKVL